MSIIVTKSTMVCPSKETPRCRLWLSKLDLMIRTPYSHTPIFYIYHHPTHRPQNGTKSTSNFFDPKILKESLSKALVPFYPVAGRLAYNKENGQYEIDCNAKGVLFIEAEATTRDLADFGDYSSPDSELRKVVFPPCDYSKGLSSFPLLIVQFTRFKCGGVCIGIMYHHHVADGGSHFHFTTSWARLARGLDLRVYPIHDRATYVGPRHPPRINYQHSDHYIVKLPSKNFPGNTTTAIECVFKISKDDIKALKQQASDELSTFFVLAAHIWRCACKSRGLVGDQDVRLDMPINGRSSLKLPKGYFGNLLFPGVCLEKAGDVMNKPLWYAATKIQQAHKRMEDIEYLRSAIDYLESHPNFESLLLRGPHFSACPNFVINSWGKGTTFRETDFGWGGPKFSSINSLKNEGQAYIIPILNPQEDGYVCLVAIKLFPSHMALFKHFIYNFNNSSLSAI